MSLSSKLHELLKRHDLAIVVLIALIAAVYYFVLLPGTQFGEPIDDAHYAMQVRNLATGIGFFDTSRPHHPIDTFVPPGFPALLTPVAVLFPNQLLPLQLVSLAFAVGAIFLTYAYLKLKQFSPAFALLIVAFVAFNPVLAKYATIIMPETTFIFCFLLLLIALHHYERSVLPISRSAVASILALFALFYLKTAPAGLLVGVILYFVMLRKFRHALMLAIGVGLFVGVLFLSRAAIGDPLIGYGYQSDLTNYYRLNPSPVPIQLLKTIATGLYQYLSFAFSVTLMPPAFLIGGLNQTFFTTFQALYAWTVAPLVILGWFSYLRRHRDASTVSIPIYLASALVLPFINERRIILILPIVITYWFMGMNTLANNILPAIFRRRKCIASGAFILMVGTLSGMLITYVYSRLYTIYVEPLPKLDVTAQTPWLKFLIEVPASDDVIEANTTYFLHYLTNHLYLIKLEPTCDTDDRNFFWEALSQTKPHFVVVTGMMNAPDQYDPDVVECLLPLLQQNPQNFVRVYSQTYNRVQIYETISAEKDTFSRANLLFGMPRYTNNERTIALNAASNLDAGTLITFATDHSARIVVPFSQPATLDTIAIGQASADTGAISKLDIKIQRMDGTWHTVDTLSNVQIGYVSVANAATPTKPYYYLKLPEPVAASAIQLEFHGDGWFILHDLAAIGVPINSAGVQPALDGYTAVSLSQTSWQPVVGTWAGHQSSIGLFDGTAFYLPGAATPIVSLDADIQPMSSVDAPIPVVGSWDAAQPKTQLGVFNNGVFMLQAKDRVRIIPFGLAGDRPVVGDWDGDGITTIGVYRRGTFYLTNNPDGGDAEYFLTLRQPTADDPDDLSVTPLAGDWDGDGKDTPGLFITDTFLLWNSPKTSDAPTLLVLGIPGDVPLVGDWDGNGKTNIGISRGTSLYLADEAGIPYINQPKIEISKIIPAPSNLEQP